MNEKKWQGKLAERFRVRRLVQGLLGCACPQEVFDHYQVRPRVIQPLPVIELIMGDRLLVWLIDSGEIGGLEETLIRLLREGRSERDRRGLNRFRLAVVGGASSLEREWAHLAAGLGPKVHLHALTGIPEMPDHEEGNRGESRSPILASR